jgi:ribosomal protein S18 acetylase RimI-like enzyme
MNGTLVPPVGWPASLRSGRVRTGRYAIRPATQDDAPLIREFVCGLSVRTQYFRFFTAVSPPSGGLLRALTGSAGRADILVVTDESGAVIGHGMAVDTDADASTGVTRRAADIGLVIADEWQGQGLGSQLLTLVSERAAARGVRVLLLEVLPDNRRMLGIIERRWPDAHRKRMPDALSITAEIEPPELDSPVLPGHLLAAALLDCAARSSGAARSSSAAMSNAARSNTVRSAR